MGAGAGAGAAIEVRRLVVTRVVISFVVVLVVIVEIEGVVRAKVEDGGGDDDRDAENCDL